MKDVIVIGGAPGSGKSTVAALLQRRLDCPLLELGWLPEFRFTGTERIGFHEEEALAFENLCLVVQNYRRHGFRNIIVTDLTASHIARLTTVLQGHELALFTLRVDDDDLLRRRVLDESRSSAYRDAEQAVAMNAVLHARPAGEHERFVDVGARSAEQVADEIEACI